MKKTTTCQICDTTIERKPGARGPLPKRCDGCRTTTHRSRRRRSDRKRRGARYDRPARRCGEYRSHWELLRADLGWPLNVPPWALRASGHDPRWYSFDHWPKEVVLARRYGKPMPEGFERYPGATDPEPEPKPEPVPGREERQVLEETEQALADALSAPEEDAGVIALPKDVEALRVAESTPRPIEPETPDDDLRDGSVQVDLTKSGGYVDRRGSRKRDLTALERYVRRFGPNGLDDDDLGALREWLDEHGEELPPGL